MKIETKRGYVAILREESGEVVGVFMPSLDARESMETAVSMHFDVACGLVEASNRDFKQPFDINEEYTFAFYDGSDDYVTLFMNYAPLFTGIDVTHYIHRKEVSNDNKTKLVRVIDTWGLDEDTISKIEEVMMYTNDYIENDTLFVELHNSKNEVIRIFPERIQEIRKEVTND